MRIVLFSTGNIEYLIELSNALSKKEDVILILPDHLDKRQVSAISQKVVFSPYRFIDFKSVRKNLKMVFKLIKKIRGFNPDILHIQSDGHPWFPLVYFFIKKCTVINTIHDATIHPGDKASSFRDHRLSIFFGKIFTRKYIVHGNYIKEELIKHYRVKSNRVHIIKHGHHGIYKKWQVKNSIEIPNTILFFGRIWEYKGLQYLIKTEPIISKRIPDIKIIIAGHGEEFSRYYSLIEKPDKFWIKNYKIPLEEVGELFQQASVVVLPYVEASQSGVIPIAYSFGKPVIATSVGALPEVVKDGVTGFLVRPKDEYLLAEKIIYLLENDTLRKEMGRNAYEYSNTILSWDNIAGETIALYNSAL